MKQGMKRTEITLPIPFNGKNLLLHWAQQFKNIVWLDSNQHPSNNFEGILAIDSIQHLTSNHHNVFDKLSNLVNNTNDYLFGYIGYDTKNDIEPRLSSANEDFLHFDDLSFFQPKKIIEIQDGNYIFRYLIDEVNEVATDYDNICKTSIPHHSNTPTNVKARFNKTDYLETVKKIQQSIHRGDIYEMNFCQEFYAKNSNINPIETYLHLNNISKPPFASFVKNKNQFLLCASPERFIKKQENTIISQPIKGTAKRDANPTTDASIIHQLKNNTKEISENVMIVDLVRNDLSHIAQKGSVKVTELCEIYSFEQVHQMISTITCEVKDKTNVVDIIKACFPMGSMTGAPKIAAMEIIEKTERTKRGLYSGAVGYFTPNKDFDFNVVIRSILYNQSNQYVSFTVGSAITAKSVAEQEYEECLLKAKAMKQVLENPLL